MTGSDTSSYKEENGINTVPADAQSVVESSAQSAVSLNRGVTSSSSIYLDELPPSNLNLAEKTTDSGISNSQNMTSSPVFSDQFHTPALGMEEDSPESSQVRPGSGGSETLEGTKNKKTGTDMSGNSDSSETSIGERAIPSKSRRMWEEFKFKLIHYNSTYVDPYNDALTKNRTIYVNMPLPPQDLDSRTGFPKMQFARNKIRTTKYTPLSFVPKNIYFQFHNIANIYFLAVAILSAFSIFGVSIPGLAAVPIISIVIITAIKDAIEDYRRTVLDLELNNTVTSILSGYRNPNVLDGNISTWRKFKKFCTRFFLKIYRSIKRGIWKRHRKSTRSRDHSDIYHDPDAELYTIRSLETGGSRSLHEELLDDDEEDYGTVIDPSIPITGKVKFRRNYWKNVKCGDLLKIHNDEEVPADIVILSTSDADGACYIETRNLDGETNLKVRQCLKATSKIKRSRDLEQAVFKVECERPHPGLYSFNGVLKFPQPLNNTDPQNNFVFAHQTDHENNSTERSEPISINNFLLRGSVIRNTKWVIGVVVYTGGESKIMLNGGSTPAKRSRIIRTLNFNVIVNFALLFGLAIVAGVYEGVYWGRTNTSLYYFEYVNSFPAASVQGFITFWAAVILLQNLVPISLYISIEIIRTVQAWFIYSDFNMYYAPLDYRCIAKSWNISDDLGQLEYIFSDKTGTLTQNVMEFRKCTINGVSYGKAFTEAMLGMLKRSGEDYERIATEAKAEIVEEKASMITQLRAISDNKFMYDDEIPFVSANIVDAMTGGDGEEQKQAIDKFALGLSLCHSVIPEIVGESQSRIEFKAQSPDEAALLEAAKDLGYVFIERTRTGVILQVQGVTKEYTLLRTLEFNSARKRMSVIIKPCDSDKILLICKGADSMIYSRLGPHNNQDMLTTTAQHLEEYANEGLRTLCLAQRELTPEQYESWLAKHIEASSALEDREEKMEEVADEIEQDLTLLGGTAIEDRLQDGVPDTIALLGQAGIKLWVLTGDKVETAINIGYSCNLLEGGMDLLVVQVPSSNEGLLNQRDIVEKHLEKYLGYFQLQGTNDEIKVAAKDHSVPSPKYGVVVDGDVLKVMVGDEELEKKFVLLCKQCRSVLCCRVSPAQKAAIVRMVKQSLDVTTLAIGDGANDVAMIQEADVGVGIAGLEGRQAVMSSDYAIAQFRFLANLVLVHGHWSYMRVAELTANLFYKNVVFTLTLFWYEIFNSFDTSYLFNYTYITLFNLAFTSLPVILLGFLDQDVPYEVLLKIPKLYQVGIFKKLWTQTKFWYV